MKEIKFKKVIKWLNKLDHCKIYTRDEEDYPIYEGSVMDIPWFLLEYYLDNDEHHEWEAIGAYYDPNASGIKFGLCINLKEPEYVNK